MFDIFYDNSEGDSFVDGSLAKDCLRTLNQLSRYPSSIIVRNSEFSLFLNQKKFIAASDDKTFNMATYLDNFIDPNICLYRLYVISSNLMNNTHLHDFNLAPICEKEPENDKQRNVCWNFLRFPDLTDPTEIYNKGIMNQVTCKL